MSPTVTLDACPICGDRRLVRLPTPGRWVDGVQFAEVATGLGLQRCRGCGFEFVNPRPGPALLDRFYQGADYAAHAPESSAAATRQAGVQLDVIARFARLPARPRLLDYGCGGGHLLDVARGRGWDVLGYDVGAESLAACRARGLAVIDRSDALPARRFDVVVISHVFEHVADHGEVLRLVAAILAPDGAVCLEVPNARSLRARLSPPAASRRLGFDERHRAFPIHLSYFGPATLRRALERHGFAVRGMTTSGVGVLRPGPDRDDAGDAPATPATAAPPPRSLRGRARSLAKRAFFDLRLGENLIAVAARAYPP